jgi:predicted DsbA family dithiol-disulfide isomerase
MLQTDEYADQVRGEITEGQQIGVRGVPFFVLNRKYGVSGAQPVEYFQQVLEKLWEEEKPQFESIDGASDGAVCNDETCEI